MRGSERYGRETMVWKGHKSVVPRTCDEDTGMDSIRVFIPRAVIICGIFGEQWAPSARRESA